MLICNFASLGYTRRAMEHPVYLDNAATTPLDPRVLEAMLSHLRGPRGNPSSLHATGTAAREAPRRRLPRRARRRPGGHATPRGRGLRGYEARGRLGRARGPGGV